MNILEQIVNDHGYITSENLPLLAAEYPDMHVVIKWSCRPRSICAVKDVQLMIDKITSSDNQEYVREVFISAGKLDEIREEMGLTIS